MRFDPLHEQPLTDVYPALTRRKKFFPNDQLLRFIILFMAPDSPYALEKDWDLRIDGALSELDLDRSSEVYKLFEENTDVVQEGFFQMFKLFADVYYEVWFSLRQSFHILNAKLRDPWGLKDNDRTRIMAQMKSITKELVDIEYRVFSEDYIKDLILESASTDSLSGYAEMYAIEPERE